MCPYIIVSPTKIYEGQETVTLHELRLRVANLEGEIGIAEEEVLRLRQQSLQFRLQVAIALMRIANST